MRARNIKPGFFENEKLAELEPVARILFAGLWCYADREGRFEWRIKRIKACILPYDDVDITCHLQALASNGFIVKYGVNGSEYGQIVNFKKHQSPHPHEAKSVIPEYNQCQGESVTSNLQVSDKSPKCQADIMILGYSDSKDPAPSAASKTTIKELTAALNTQCKTINSLTKKQENFNPHQWVQYAINHKYHPEAISHTLDALISNWDGISTPWTYANKIISVESGNYYERDGNKSEEKYKMDFIDLVNDLKAFRNSKDLSTK